MKVGTPSLGETGMGLLCCAGTVAAGMVVVMADARGEEGVVTGCEMVSL